MNSDRLNLGMVLFAAILFLITVLILPGCGVMKDIDKGIWNPLAMTAEEIDKADPPPIMEAAAGILAALGYGGFAVWIKSVKKNGNARIVDLQHQIAELQAEMAHHKENLHPLLSVIPPVNPN